MGFESLKGYVPQKVKDGGEPFKVTANAEVTYCRIEDYSGEIAELKGTRWLSYELTICDDADFSGRKLWKRFNLGNDDKLQELADVMFTLLGKDIKSEEDLQLCCEALAGQLVKVRAWVWTPEKDVQGNVIPKDQREPRQMHMIKKVLTGAETEDNTPSSSF